MEQMKDNWARNYKNVTIKMTDGSVIKGKINIRETGRLSHLFKTLPENFITLVPEEGGKKVFIINKNFILWAESEDWITEPEGSQRKTPLLIFWPYSTRERRMGMKACEIHENCIVVFNADDCPLCKTQKMLTTVWEEVEKSMGILKELKGTAEQAGLKLGSSWTCARPPSAFSSPGTERSVYAPVAKASVRRRNMAVGIESEEIAKGLDGDDGAGEGIPLRPWLALSDPRVCGQSSI
jgi:hypothetical protein